jgi:hypothetical protein
MRTSGSTPETALPDHPYRAEIEAEHEGWYELVSLVRSLTLEECLEPGYYRKPGLVGARRRGPPGDLAG